MNLNKIVTRKISIKKSTFNGLILGLVLVVGIAAFFAGSYTTNLNSNQISEEDLQKTQIAKLELKNITKPITYRNNHKPQ